MKTLRELALEAVGVKPGKEPKTLTARHQAYLLQEFGIRVARQIQEEIESLLAGDVQGEMVMGSIDEMIWERFVNDEGAGRGEQAAD
ncbi:MAG: hypothetical protein GWO24_31050 [Akkermansiaceae bacterium]|nr:hypothetical protein [Akkermansiaceae bacterium]NIS11201.1 hypothetical protein [Thermoplasmata archaeon]NIS19139.1 hypothetical protein [Thermoplasmata archaeon]NIT76195.1 hypothetical protein [Thermoplasmata archaeon]NIY02566.1 hypothetical protein [Thermoplasmata archaeon]